MGAPAAAMALSAFPCARSDTISRIASCSAHAGRVRRSRHADRQRATLSLSKLVEDRLFSPSRAHSGSIFWTSTRTGERIGSISYEADLDQQSGRVRLKYTTTRYDGEKRASDYWIQLETTPQPFGGRRWWLICPRTGKRAAKLYLPNGAFTFASRQAHGLAYACQREPAHDRALRRALKLRGKLGGTGGIGGYISKPRWMREATYDRKLEEIFAAEEVVDAHMEVLVRKVDRCLGR
jgi:hypothetical protein